MKNEKTIIGVISNIERLNSSYNGNPRFSCDIDAVKHKTMVDCSTGYAIQNFKSGDIVQVTTGSHYGIKSIRGIKKAEAK